MVASMPTVWNRKYIVGSAGRRGKLRALPCTNSNCDAPIVAMSPERKTPLAANLAGDQHGHREAGWCRTSGVPAGFARRSPPRPRTDPHPARHQPAFSFASRLMQPREKHRGRHAYLPMQNEMLLAADVEPSVGDRGRCRHAFTQGVASEQLIAPVGGKTYTSPRSLAR